MTARVYAGVAAVVLGASVLAATVACSSNPFAGFGSKSPDLDTLIKYDQPAQTAVEALPPQRGAGQRIVVRQRFLKRTADKNSTRGAETAAYEFEPRQGALGVALAKFDDPQFEALEKHPKLLEHGRATVTTVVNQPAYNMLDVQDKPDLAFTSLTPVLLVDGRYRITFDKMPSGARLTKPFTIDVEANRWYAVPLTVRRSEGDAKSHEQIYCVRVELESMQTGNLGASDARTLMRR